MYSCEIIAKANIIVCCIHRHPNSMIDYFTKSIDRMVKNQKGILFVCGYLNIDLMDCNLNNHTQNLPDRILTL